MFDIYSVTVGSWWYIPFDLYRTNENCRFMFELVVFLFRPSKSYFSDALFSGLKMAFVALR